jgi:hypothetical protein
MRIIAFELRREVLCGLVFCYGLAQLSLAATLEFLFLGIYQLLAVPFQKPLLFFQSRLCTAINAHNRF